MSPEALSAFEGDVRELQAALRAEAGPEDVSHMRRLIRWSRACSLIGLAAAFVFPNPVAWFGLGLGSFTRWAIVAHHTIHGGFDRVPGAPVRWASGGFARGWRRLFEWHDWMHPDAWHHEHDVLHHYKLGERGGDPDLAEDNLDMLRESRLPYFLRGAIVLLASVVWKPLYYAPNTMNALLNAEARRRGEPELSIYRLDAWLPWTRRARAVWLRCWLPYALPRFVLIPLAAGFVFGETVGLYVLVNLAVGEAIANLWSFWVIVPNHTGEDLYRFEGGLSGRGEFYLRQIVGSANYRTGGDLRDFLHGWLNYQIEHHVFPDLSPRQYQRAQPRLRALCERHGVPYVQEGIWQRMGRTWDVLIGRRSMLRWPEAPVASDDAEDCDLRRA